MRQALQLILGDGHCILRGNQIGLRAIQLRLHFLHRDNVSGSNLKTCPCLIVDALQQLHLLLRHALVGLRLQDAEVRLDDLQCDDLLGIRQSCFAGPNAAVRLLHRGQCLTVEDGLCQAGAEEIGVIPGGNRLGAKARNVGRIHAPTGRRTDVGKQCRLRQRFAGQFCIQLRPGLGNDRRCSRCLLIGRLQIIRQSWDGIEGHVSQHR